METHGEQNHRWSLAHMAYSWETAADEVTSHMQKYELGASGEYRQELRAVGLCEVPLRRGC